ncbi:sugar ABC transporter permease [Clostridium saccharoperbutylacetonicum]|uniref:Carbohydrate ABC transporter membrane protein 2, CUT1 family n=1 Tax=Clostridium saccharoperbutylacetonicum N1-4(HMT) TaxID=931276 RepID=M1MWE0_9CLOT|nr:ABC transporter permease subunit [Clostridium saccharoperbutylacetonicum]AGF58921.1 carbohydrate ABC transporter membrane protein 2, CUT1 family [Clostridium saccharoperbutylacetonicum N1-4(HMT)]AQR97592.1 maltose transport system permease protein MalG [Clostridium saccharoperbutylacetonicum]NRT60293.1 arabinogalactan oligomer/maltooligosaccharide transport system permease protein [Clostridium saccharoperbutylacetonicum]NSB23605.1 arabinogalactan oligomer/maltooligosaccharide transport syste
MTSNAGNLKLNNTEGQSEEIQNIKLKYVKKLRPAEIRTAWISRIVLWIMIVIVLIPIMAVVSASMAKGNSFTQTSIFPKSFTLENYVKVITQTKFLIWARNSLVVCFSVAMMQLIMTIPAAFAFSKLRFKGRKFGLMTLLILQMFPNTMALPAILSVAYNIRGGMDNLLPLILIISVGSAYNIWLMKGYMDGIPKELTETAYIDGATTFQAFIKVVLPLIKNMIIVIFIFAFVGAYSEFLFTSALIKDQYTETLATGMQGFIKDHFSANWTQYSAAAIMASLPVVLISVFSQKFFAKGLTAGSVKG